MRRVGLVVKRSDNTLLTATPPPVSPLRVTAKMHMAGIRADKKTLAAWAREAEAAGMSLNKWACLVLNSAPKVKPAAITETGHPDAAVIGTKVVKRGKRSVLIVESNVTDLTKGEIDYLAGDIGHPDVAVIGTKVVKHGKRSVLIVEFDITGLTEGEIDYLASEAAVRGEASNGHPDVKATATAKVVVRARKS